MVPSDDIISDVGGSRGEGQDLDLRNLGVFSEKGEVVAAEFWFLMYREMYREQRREMPSLPLLSYFFFLFEGGVRGKEGGGEGGEAGHNSNLRHLGAFPAGGRRRRSFGF